VKRRRGNSGKKNVQESGKGLGSRKEREYEEKEKSNDKWQSHSCHSFTYSSFGFRKGEKEAKGFGQ